jgi:hypothetical protein
MRRTATSSGLLLLLVGVVLLSAFVNGALPRLLETLFGAAKSSTGTTTAARAAGIPASPGLPTIGTGQVAIA